MWTTTKKTETKPQIDEKASKSVADREDDGDIDVGCNDYPNGRMVNVDMQDVNLGL